MTRLLLKYLNAPVLILLALVGVAIQSSFFTFWLLPYFQPDLILLLVLWCALRRDFYEGGILTLVLANIAEIHSASPRGVFLSVYMSVYLLVRLAVRVLVIPDLSSYVLVTVFATVFAKVSSLGIIYLLGISVGKWKHIFLFLFPGALANAVIAHWAFQSLEKLDWLTHKTARADQLLEDELQPEGGEI